MDVREISLSNKFFRENPLMDLSAAVIAHYSITAKLDEKLEQRISSAAAYGIDEVRKEKIQQERYYIEQTYDPATLVEIMRRGHDILNQRLLCTKILALSDQTMPLLLRRYRTCMMDHFIDAAMTTFSMGEKKYTLALRDMYADIRCPYAKACACLVFGMQNMKEEISFLLDEYKSFKREYPDETFHQHPLLALYILHGRFP